jgi:hypothetical protein
LTNRNRLNQQPRDGLKACLVAVLLMVLAGQEATAAGSDDAQALRRGVTMLLTTTSGEPLGSAVVVGSAEGGQWLVTSRHVVETVSRVCVVAFAGEARAAQVLVFREPASRQALDVALLWRPDPGTGAKPPNPSIVAEWASPMPLVAEFPVVTASGYPASSDDRQPAPRYTESTGLLLPLLTAPIEGGFDLTSTVTVGKGMSGGGLFLGNRLVGINGTHAHPLWSGVLLSGAGQPIDPALNARLEQVSLGVSATTIKRLLQSAVKPTQRELKGIETVNCGPQPVSPGSF